MGDHKTTLSRRRARGRIASVNQLDTAAANGARPQVNENRTPPSSRSARVAPGLIIFLAVLFGLLLAHWFMA